MTPSETHSCAHDTTMLITARKLPTITEQGLLSFLERYLPFINQMITFTKCCIPYMKMTCVENRVMYIQYFKHTEHILCPEEC